MGKKIVFYLLLVICNTAVAQKNISHWIATSEDSLTKPNTWHCFRKTFDLSNIPKQAALSIATDTKYWLWINGRLIVYEGGIKRGPNPFDTYYDRVDVAPFLKRGSNVIAVLVWFWGGKGFSHKNSGRSALWAECSDIGLLTDLTWKAIVHPAYGPSKLPNPNFRLSEPNIFYDARNEFVTTDNSMWFDTKFTDKQWTKAKFAGNVNDYPWHKLVLRPIPLFKFHKPKEYINVSYIRCKDQDTIVAKLPYNGHFSPILKVNAPAGRRIVIASDTYYLGSLSAQDSLYTLASEYITRNGEQSYESYLWLSGHEIRYVIPKDVKVLSLAYRETGYNASFSGSFLCNDSLLISYGRRRNVHYM